jgi:hypothetical protein
MPPIMYIAKQLLQLERVVWLLWMPKDIWQAKNNLFSLFDLEQKNPSK